MSKLINKDLHSACSNGNGTYNGLTAMRWLFEAATGKPMSEEEARAAYEEAKRKRSSNVTEAS